MELMEPMERVVHELPNDHAVEQKLQFDTEDYLWEGEI